MSSSTMLMRWLHKLGPSSRSTKAVLAADPSPVPGTWRLGHLEVGPRRGSSQVSTKATNLDRARAAGIAVPTGFIIPDECDVTGQAVVAWAQAAKVERLAVRSAFSAEDQRASSLAGWFDSFLRVQPGEVLNSVERVRASADRREGDFRRDILVMAMVDAKRAGVVFSEPETFDDLVNVIEGTAEALVGGEEAGERLVLPRAEAAEEHWQNRLRRMLDDVRATFGDEPWDIEWADDGAECWLVQLRPITTPIRRDELLTIANHAEILPALPSRLMASVVGDAGEELFGWYRAFDPTLPAQRDFLHVVAGRPFINLSLLEDMLRHWGLPTALIAGAIGGDSGANRPPRLGRLIRKAPVLIRLGLFQVWAVLTAHRRERNAASFGRGRIDTFAEALQRSGGAYVALVTGMFPLSSAIGPPLAALRRAGTLNEHASRHRTITTEMVDALARAQRDPSAVPAFLERFGHRGVYESDLSRPRYRDNPSLLQIQTPTASHAPPMPPRRTARGLLTLPLWWATSQPMAARERLRHESMRSFADLHHAFARLGADAVEVGQLRSVGDVWDLTTTELRALDEGWVPDEVFWSERERDIARLAALNPPPLVHRFDDPADWVEGPSNTSDAVYRGLSLTDGTVQGRAWVLHEPSSSPPSELDGETIVLIARSIDAGWIPAMLMSSAVVAEIGGDLSHGSILLREHGIPAVTNVRGVTRAFVTGDLVEVRAGAGRIERRGVSANARSDEGDHEPTSKDTEP